MTAHCIPAKASEKDSNANHDWLTLHQQRQNIRQHEIFGDQVRVVVDWRKRRERQEGGQPIRNETKQRARNEAKKDFQLSPPKEHEAHVLALSQVGDHPDRRSAASRCRGPFIPKRHWTPLLSHYSWTIKPIASDLGCQSTRRPDASPKKDKV